QAFIIIVLGIFVLFAKEVPPLGADYVLTIGTAQGNPRNSEGSIHGVRPMAVIIDLSVLI
ncbi:MAG: hypothetical protein Q4G59_11190, partial [Planctomycetia bacterium]|nr:hypothetical protein [Planctomycetia bacterium]